MTVKIRPAQRVILICGLALLAASLLLFVYVNLPTVRTTRQFEVPKHIPTPTPHALRLSLGEAVDSAWATEVVP